MTILYILISTDPFGGATKSFLVLLQGVLKAGIKAIVVVPDTNGITSTLHTMGAEVIIIPSKGCTWTGAKTLRQTILYIPRQLGRLWVDYNACKRLYSTLKQRHIDIVHSNNTVTALGRYIATKRNIPHIYHIREYGDKDFGLRYFPSNTAFHKYLKSDNVYSICITKDIQLHHGLSQHKLSTVIYNGIIQDESRRHLVTTPRNYFLYAGRIEPTKGLLKLIIAYKAYVDSITTALPLKVVGEVFDYTYMNKIEKYIRINNLQSLISFLGKQSDMPRYYEGAKAIIIPSEHEGFGRCMPEAMSHGCIVIGHNTGGTKEQFENGYSETGQDIGFPYNTQEELTKCLITVHKSEEQNLEKIRKNAYDTVCRLYSFNNNIQSTLDLYKTITNKK